MSRPVACQGDTILCITCPKQPVTGVIWATSSARTFVGGKPPVLNGDLGVCGLPTAIIASQVRLFIEGRAACRLGDLNTCTGPVIGPGDPTVLIGD